AGDVPALEVHDPARARPVLAGPSAKASRMHYPVGLFHIPCAQFDSAYLSDIVGLGVLACAPPTHDSDTLEKPRECGLACLLCNMALQGILRRPLAARASLLESMIVLDKPKLD